VPPVLLLLESVDDLLLLIHRRIAIDQLDPAKAKLRLRQHSAAEAT
jgi:hypothetical protein